MYLLSKFGNSDAPAAGSIIFGARGQGTASRLFGTCNNVGARDVTVHMFVALLILILATLVAGPIGFVVVGALLLAWALVTGTLHLVLELLVLPFRALGALARRGR